MPNIVVLSASVRTGRASHRVALYLERYITMAGHSVDLIDLAAYDFPIFHERLKFQREPLPTAVEFAGRIRNADAVIIVTPEYNGGYPAALKNVIDLLNEEWRRKPVALSPCSDGGFGGAQVMQQVLFPLWKIKAWMVNANMQVPKVKEAFDEQGVPQDAEAWAKRAKALLDEVLWCVEAKRRMDSGA